MRGSAVAACALVFLLATQPAEASWSWMRDSVVSEFDAADWDLLKARARSALDDVENGQRVDWSNPESGNRGAMKPLMTMVVDGRTCRRIAFLNIARDGVRGESAYSFCRQDDGTWAFVSDGELRR